MSKARAATDQVVKLIVGAGQASPSPPVGPALGSKGVKSIDFCKVHLPIPKFPSTPYASIDLLSPLPPSRTTTDAIRAGVQRPHGAHPNRDPDPRARHRAARPQLPLRAPHADDGVPAADGGRGAGGEGQAEGARE